MATKESVFETLSKVDVSKHVDVIQMKKGPALSYVSWSWAWSMVKSYYPDTPTPVYTKFPEMKLETHKKSYEVDYNGKKYTRYYNVIDDAFITERKVPYLTTTTGTMVECTVTIQGEPYTESLFVMDNSNKPVINPTMAEINKTQKRCMVKALALAGLGLNLYAGEDLPMGDVAENDKKAIEEKQKKEAALLEEVRKSYTNLLSEVAVVTGNNVGDVEAGVKETLEGSNPDFDTWSERLRKSKMIDMFKRILKKHGAQKQQEFEEVDS
ncbi:DUF1071 domain-containing protein [Limosilactobacillus antri]|uniref:Sak single strand annealing protein n=1 Tax=Limosilactobacillus antri TaxID=227943 RepID=UPI001F55D84D|nr:DUF1071 domain-containing protein [Limosilactobacillus antri]